MLFRSSAEKPTLNTPLGLHFWATPDSSIIIVRVDDHGLFAGRGLKAGMQLERINDFLIGGGQVGAVATVAQLQAYLAQLSGRITILASGGQRRRHDDDCDDHAQRTMKAKQFSRSMMDTAPPPTLTELSECEYSDDDDSSYSSWESHSSSDHDDTSDREMEDEIVEAMLYSLTF